MKNRTNLIFLHKLIKAIADSLLKIFLPLLVLKNSGSLLFVMIYLNVYYFLCCFLNFALKKFLQKYGIIAMILHTIPIVALQFVINLSINVWVILLLALLASLAQVLYSVPLNLLFAFSDKETNVAKFQIATNVGKLVFTIVSGFVIGSGYKNSILILSVAGSVLYIASVIPIFYGYGLLKNSYDATFKQTPMIDTKTYRTFNLFHICFSIFQSVLDVLVPIYLFVNNLTFETVATIVALVEIFKIGANLFAKHLVSKNKSFVSVLISISFFVAGCTVLLTVKVPVVLFVSSSLIAISFPLLFVPMFKHFCGKVKSDFYEFEGMAYRDVYIFGGKCLMYLPYFLIPSLFTPFAIGIASAFGVGATAFLILKKPGK